MDNTAVSQTNLPLPLFGRGKVRDTYDLGDRLLMVSTDRLSAFDVVLPTPLPGRGIILNQMAAYWFTYTRNIVANHLLSTDIADFPAAVQQSPYREQVVGRAMLVRKVQRLDLECVVRGYLAGGGWADYQRTGALCAIPLPTGLLENARLDVPIFTPSTKATSGHDQNISFAQAVEIVGEKTAERLRDLSLQLYAAASIHAEARGIIIADTKFEFGLDEAGAVILIDEALTPDSSRFWQATSYRPGQPAHSFDKQFVRDWLKQSGWDRQAPPPDLPPEIVAATLDRYQQALARLTS